MAQTNNSFNEKQKLQEEGYNFPYHYLDLISDEYKFIRSIEYLSYLRAVKQLLLPCNEGHLLDAGCGDGRFCYELRGENMQISGVDFSAHAIAFARAFNPHAKFYVADLRNFALSNTFEYIVLIETLEHFVPEERNNILKNLSRALTKGGKLIVTVPSTRMPLAEKHYEHFSAETLRQLLSPYFIVISICGCSKINLQRHLYLNLKRLGLLLLPFRPKVPFLDKYFTFIAQYYEQHLRDGKPEECERLIAVCSKNA